jgi:probable FeS assembly SUF system protein SufT
MQELMSVELKRDCEAVQIPVGDKVTLPTGTAVDITQSLGGSYTVRAPQGLFRIEGKDADALGIDADAQLQADPKSKESTATTDVDEQQLWEALKQCFDPEIPVNIVDLGLVYDLKVSKLPTGSNRVDAKITLTAPGCGMGTYIAADAQQRLMEVNGVEDASVDVVWDPPWHQSMISAEGRRVLGLE